MATLRVAHISEQGQEMILVPLDDSFGQKTSEKQNAVSAEIQTVAAAAGLRGTVVIVWETGGRFHFMGPREWHPFLRSLSMLQILSWRNRALTW